MRLWENLRIGDTVIMRGVFLYGKMNDEASGVQYEEGNIYV